MIYITADTHFSHANILKHCHRPFGSILEHDQILIDNWNTIVSPSDTVYHLGDFAWSRAKTAKAIFYQLNGKIVLVRGNHDKKVIKGDLLNLFQKVCDYETLTIQIAGKELFVVMSHYPFETWDRSHYGSVHLHGHCHGNLKRKIPNRIDVGVDCWVYQPTSIYALVNAALLSGAIFQKGETDAI